MSTPHTFTPGRTPGRMTPEETHEALRHRCPKCGAEPGEACTLRGRAHWKRLKATMDADEQVRLSGLRRQRERAVRG